MGRTLELSEYTTRDRSHELSKPVAVPPVQKRFVFGAMRMRNKELPAFARELATMLGAGISLDEALHTLAEESEGPAFRIVLRNVRESVMRGTSLTAALAQYPAIFDPMFVQMLRSGEVSGALTETLERLASYLEFSAELRRKVGAAMMYPVLVVAIALTLFTCMMVWIVPAFEQIYQDLGGALPGPTQLLVNVSRGVRANGVWVFLGGLVGVLTLARLRHTDWGGHIYDRLALHVPVFGTIRQKTALTRFAQSLAQMLRNGIPILNALELSGVVTGNRVFERAIRNARLKVARGETLSSALRRERCFPRMVVKMIAVGEKTGKTDAMLERVGRFYGQEVAAMLTALTSLVEPMLIVFVGLLVGGIVLGMFLPIFKLHEIVVF